MAGAIAAGAIVAIALLGAATAARAAAELNKPAPAFAAVDTNGHKVSLADFRGKTVILEWTNHDCPYVRRHYGLGNMQALQKEASAAGAVWLSVISSAPGTQGHVSPAEANQLTKSRGAAPAKVLIDESGAVGRLYAAQVTPHMYIVDPNGTLVYRGGIDDHPTPFGELKKGTRNFVRLALADMKAGTKIKHDDTRPYGCTVKYAE
jgi:peroxiredoxin